jgi:hypothetical protein
VQGYVVNWDLENQIWSRLFGKKGIDVSVRDEEGAAIDLAAFSAQVKTREHSIVVTGAALRFLSCHPSVA